MQFRPICLSIYLSFFTSFFFKKKKNPANFGHMLYIQSRDSASLLHIDRSCEQVKQDIQQKGQCALKLLSDYTQAM